MFGNRWHLFRLLGIPISVDASWLVILALLTVSLGSVFPSLQHEYFPDVPDRLQSYQYWIMGLVAALGFFGCILLHELGHAIVARSRGMPIHGINLFLFGGVAEIGDEPPSARTEFLMAIAGPLVSLCLAILLALLSWIGYQGGWPHPAVIIFGYLAVINAVVLAFNLVPAFPLDGGRVLRSIIWGASGDLTRATYWAALLGQAFAWVLIAWGVMQFFAGNWLSGVWSGLIGWFLHNAATGSYQQLLMKQALHGEAVRHFMVPGVTAVPPSLDLRHWVEDFVYRSGARLFPVASDGRLEGFITTDVLARIPRSEWEAHTVGEFMRQDLKRITISPDADALEAMSRMRRIGASRLLVTEHDQLLGTVSLRDLLRFLDLKLELERGQREGGWRDLNGHK